MSVCFACMSMCMYVHGVHAPDLCVCVRVHVPGLCAYLYVYICLSIYMRLFCVCMSMYMWRFPTLAFSNFLFSLLPLSRAAQGAYPKFLLWVAHEDRAGAALGGSAAERRLAVPETAVIVHLHPSGPGVQALHSGLARTVRPPVCPAPGTPCPQEAAAFSLVSRDVGEPLEPEL